MASVGRVVVVTGDKAIKATRSKKPRKAILELSQHAINRLKYLKSISKKPVNAFRLGVKESSGCVGAAYSLEYSENEKQSNLDEVISDKESGINIVVDPAAAFFVIGTKMDYIETDTESQFVFYNPNATAVCGCGQSFSVDPQHKE